MKRFILLLFCFFLVGQDDCEGKPETASDYCWGSPDPGEEIIDTGVGSVDAAIIGAPASTNRRATLYLRSYGVGGCTATAITPSMAITAAHCVGDPMHLYVDKQDFYDGIDSYYEVIDSVQHPDWLKYLRDGGSQRYRDADIAILYLDGDLPPPYVKGFYRKVQAPNCGILIAQGWGTNGENSRTLREKEYTIIGNEGRRYQTMPVDKLGTACYGDSGGPLYAYVVGEYYLAGVSNSHFDIDCSSRNGHASTEAHLQWIYENYRE